MPILDHFDALTARGLQIIPLRSNSKIPMCKGWVKRWDREIVRSKFEQFPDANLGLLLGNIIDVEGDSDEANQRLLDLIGDYAHPCYSSTKSIHHLFLTPDLKLRHFRMGEIEFRGFGHQSVIPPSHHQGTEYRWLKTFRFPVPIMPTRLRVFYETSAYKHRLNLKPGHIRVWCYTCKQEQLLHRKRWGLEVEVFRLLARKWDCQNCRELDLRPACRLLRLGACKEIILDSLS